MKKYLSVSVDVDAYVCVQVYVLVYVLVYVCVYVNIFVFVFVHVCVHVHLHVQSVIPTLMATTRPPDAGSLLNAAPRLRAQLVQLQTTLSLEMSKPAFFLKPLGAVLRQKLLTQKKKVTSIQRHFHKRLLESLTTTLVDRAMLLSQFTSHTGSHFMQPSSEAYEAEDRCFRVSVATRVMLPHPAAPNATDVVQSCTNKSAAGLICNKPVDTQQTAPLLRMSVLRRC